MSKAQYKTQASQQRKAQNINAVEKSINRNARKQFARVAPALRRLAKQIRRECDAIISGNIKQPEELMGA